MLSLQRCTNSNKWFQWKKMFNVCLPKNLCSSVLFRSYEWASQRIAFVNDDLEKKPFQYFLTDLMKSSKIWSVRFGRCGPNKSDDNFQRSYYDLMADERTIISKLESIFWEIFSKCFFTLSKQFEANKYFKSKKSKKLFF